MSTLFLEVLQGFFLLFDNLTLDINLLFPFTLGYFFAVVFKLDVADCHPVTAGHYCVPQVACGACSKILWFLFLLVVLDFIYERFVILQH